MSGVVQELYTEDGGVAIVADNNKLQAHLGAAVVHDAAKADAAEHHMTLRQAFKVHKKAIFWSMALSGALIMEGYDVVVVSNEI